MLGSEFLRRGGFYLLVFEALLGAAHLLWPEYRWGQGRQSYFNFDNRLTLASWLISMQLLGVAILALIGFYRDRWAQATARPDRSPDHSSQTAWVWIAGAIVALALSFAEMTRIHTRFELLGLPDPNVYEQIVISLLTLGLLVLFGWFLLHKLQSVPDYYKFGVGWLVAWSAHLVLESFASAIPSGWQTEFSLVTGLTYLFGSTLLLIAVGGYVLRSNAVSQPSSNAVSQTTTTKRWRWPVGFPTVRIQTWTGRTQTWILLGVGGTAFTLIFLQIILFQLVTISDDYLTANSVISIALLGMAVGGLIGYLTARQVPYEAMVSASLLLPIAILLAFATTVTLTDSPLVASVLLMAPFICASTVLTIALVKIDSHVAYFADLVGAGLGALLVNAALTNFREESSLLFLAAFAFLVAAGFIVARLAGPTRTWLAVLAAVGALGLVLAGGLNLEHDWLNVVRIQVKRQYPQADILFSRSSFIGRYDIVHRGPGHPTLKAYENGRTIDTIRDRPLEAYQIDPRIPHTLMKDPTILILGLSGDGVTKTARELGGKVYGVEINPAVVSLQTNELVPLNANSYQDIDVTILDARSYVEQSDLKYDMITLLNTHLARGHTTGRSPSPEYLFTAEAIHEYLDHLTDRGVVLVEEVVNNPQREPPVWKLLWTMRQVLLERGSTQPEQHFFVFQWRTASNNYIQIVMKKTPFTQEEIVKLNLWLEDVDNIREIERDLDRQVSPITAVTTVLHTPGEALPSNVSRLVRGEVEEDFLRARNLRVTIDDRPFHFDVDPARPEVKRVYARTFVATLILLAFFVPVLGRQRSKLLNSLPLVLVVVLTGLGFLLLEIVLIRRYELFLGAPVATFASVLGTLLIFSGLGSLWSRRIDTQGVYRSIAAIVVLLLIHQWVMPEVFPLAASLHLTMKIILAVITIAPLAFFLGVPFPFILRSSKSEIAESAAATMFGLNTAASALAVPLAIYLSMNWGLNVTFQIGIIIYGVVWLLILSLQKQGIGLIARWSAALVIVLLLAAPWLTARSSTVKAVGPNRHLVYGVSYGSSFI